MAYQFKITLQEIEPPIWRRIVVPKNVHLADFGYAVLDAMGWCSTCLFRVHFNKSIMVPDFYDTSIEELYYHFIKDYLDCEIEVEYDFDEELDEGWKGAWFHTVEFEGEIDPPEGFREVVSMCIDGARSCPPDFVKYAQGYHDFLEEISHKDNPDRLDIIKYSCMYSEDKEDFNPEEFDINTLKIRPARPLEMLYDFDDRYNPWLKSLGLDFKAR